MSYKIITLALDNVLSDKTLIVPPRQNISEVAILVFPAGTTIQLAFGDNPLFDVTQPITFRPDGDDGDTNNGLYWANPAAAPGVKIKVLVATDGAKTGARF